MPTVLIFEPFSVLQGVFTHGHDKIQIVLNISEFLWNGGLIFSHQVGTVNFKPLNTTFTKSFALTQQQQSSGKIITHVIQVRRHRVDSASEIDVMGKIEILDFGEGSRSIELE